MALARTKAEWTGWHSLVAFAAMGPMLANTIEKAANRYYGWNVDLVPEAWVLPPLVLGACLSVFSRIAIDWRNGKLRLALHGPLSILGASFAAFGVWHLIETASGGEVPIEATMFFLGIAAACFVMLVLPSNEHA